ncbi:hypothetical protein BDK51DRAFT_43170 [Blyttiomyces helicus]|uniref:YjeF N-terminal domain-containing protein n=1 Tax=Blyttiomyces helicus TaxID=388810 RepID=A0A4P9W4Y8_9FUNG|nr:hypothetical protein BDK51DRAFT_43170 [Blyttiomyces helicus]|eukprot:RKO85800.1 hypothetical protein BDK51DRAFT_43170 [Blyttiomyces helicus]
MATQYIGLDVRLILKSLEEVDGKVLGIDPRTQTITLRRGGARRTIVSRPHCHAARPRSTCAEDRRFLKIAVLDGCSHMSHPFAFFSFSATGGQILVEGSDIKDLKILPTPSPAAFSHATPHDAASHPSPPSDPNRLPHHPHQHHPHHPPPPPPPVHNHHHSVHHYQPQPPLPPHHALPQHPLAAPRAAQLPMPDGLLQAHHHHMNQGGYLPPPPPQQQHFSPGRGVEYADPAIVSLFLAVIAAFSLLRTQYSQAPAVTRSSSQGSSAHMSELEGSMDEETIDFNEFSHAGSGSGGGAGGGSSGHTLNGRIVNQSVGSSSGGRGPRKASSRNYGKGAGEKPSDGFLGRGRKGLYDDVTDKGVDWVKAELGQRRQQGGQSPAFRARRARRDSGEAFLEDAETISDDFDFQAGLNNFDKRNVFAQIAEADATAPEARLVSFNIKRRAPGGYDPMARLAPRENVLDTAPSGDETGNDAEVESEVEGDGLLLGGGGLEDTDGVPRDGGRDSSGRRVSFRTLSGVPVPTVTPAEMVEIERLAASETGPSDEQMIENGGRGTAMMVLQALGGSRRIKPGNHNEGPLVVVLAGNNRVGAYGLCAARHLANHECNVVACVVGSEAELVNVSSCAGSSRSISG